MAKTKTISDKLPKRKCAEWLQKNGFNSVELAKNSSCDLIGNKNGQKYFIEVKYSSKEDGNFFGTVMLTEMFQAISNKMTSKRARAIIIDQNLDKSQIRCYDRVLFFSKVVMAELAVYLIINGEFSHYDKIIKEE